MKDVYFKIVELNMYQVLLSKEYDDHENPCIAVTFHFEGIKVCQKLGYNSESKRDIAFDSISDKQVEEVVNSTVSYLLSNT